ncbi:uncharacterized protein TNCV_2701061 [Trichonephila clavipes]|nr:uncharacterized protein TNCV_2701061 [Trichonephila clavipes]
MREIIVEGGLNYQDDDMLTEEISVPAVFVSDPDCGAVGLDLNPGEDMDVCNCIVPLRHGGTLNSRQATSPLEWLVEGEDRCEASEHPQSKLPLNWGGTEPNRTVTRMVLKATANDRRHLALCHDEFRGP